MRLIRPARLLVLVALVIAACGGSDGGSDGGATTVAKPEVPAGAVAVVGDETITQEQFDELYDTAVKQGEAGGQPAPEAGSEEETTLKQQVMQALVQNAVIRQEAEERNLAVDPAKVDEDLAGFKEQCCGGKQKDYEKYLKDNGLTEAGLRDQFGLAGQVEALDGDRTVETDLPTSVDDARGAATDDLHQLHAVDRRTPHRTRHPFRLAGTAQVLSARRRTTSQVITPDTAANASASRPICAYEPNS